MDIWGAIKRMFTLPKGKNSVSDIIGASNWNAIKTTIYNSLQTAINGALTGIETAALADTDKLTLTALEVFKGVDPTFAAAIQASISASVKTSADKNAADLSATILTDLAKVIGLN